MSTETNERPTDAAQPTTTPIDTGPFPNPVAHGISVSTVLDDGNALYEHFRDFWFENVGRPENEPEDGTSFGTWDPDFLEGTYDLRFRSSRWRAGMEDENGEWTRYHKYHLTLRRRSDASRTPPISLSIQIEPQIEGLTYKNGNDFSLPYGEGTRLSIQTTYPSGPEDPIDRAFGAIETVAPDVVSRSVYQSETSRLTKLEAHIRFDITRKNAAIKTIDNTRELLAYGGSAEIDASQNRSREGYVESLLVSDRWNRLGFDPLRSPEGEEPDDQEQLLKCYQAGDWDERSPADPLHHPKLEAALAGGTVPLSAYESALSELRSKVVNHARWAGITPADLISDPFYSGSDAPSEHYPEVGDRRDDLRELQQSYDLPMYRQATHDQTDAPHDIMAVLVAESGATYETLEERTGLPRRTIEYHVKKFADLGFVERIGRPVVVVFDSVGVLDLASEVMDKTHPGETPSDRLQELEDRAEERREKRAEREAESGDEGGFDNNSDADPREDSDADSGRQSVWKDCVELGIELPTLAVWLERGYLSGRDVRVRSPPTNAPPDAVTAD